MDSIAPSNKIVDESGGNIVFSVPILNIAEISPLFKLMEEESDDMLDTSSTNPALIELRSLVKDCGISHSTLEEVFIKMTGKKESKRAAK